MKDCPCRTVLRLWRGSRGSSSQKSDLIGGVGPVTAIAQQLIQQLMQQTAVIHAGLAAGAGIAVQAGSHVLPTVLIWEQ